mgnify:FL=1
MGLVIKEIWLSERWAEHDTLTFLTDQGLVSYYAVGECCSTTWFNDILGVDALIGAKVTSVEAVDTIDVSGPHEYVDQYGYKLTTNKGYADVVFRNSSNGYYGGRLEEAVPPVMLDVQILSDWSDDA